jgi:protein-S-isoprenylcysteine O-methyltransferase Ste14
MGFIGILYWLFPEYHGDFYLPYWKLLEMILPWWLVFAIPYFYFVDAKQSEPHDGYYQAGLAVLFQFNRINGALLMQQALGWLVKGFFMALMFCYFTSDLNKFIFLDFSTEQGFRGIYDFGYYFVFLADVAVACMGYLISLRFFDTHLRMAEPTMRGWVAALACYQPFWAVLSRQYLDYSRDFAWGAWLQDKYWLYCIWGSAILMLYAIYLWATVIFGCRFSNLTHRGIITNGPYRWTKHPAYISKNLAYWLTFVPFIISESVADSLRRCALLLLLNGIYFVRARAEESMLAQDAVYREYAGWMRKNGLFRRFGRVLPWAAKK